MDITDYFLKFSPIFNKVVFDDTVEKPKNGIWKGKGIEQTALITIEQINKINHLFNKTQKLVQEKLPRIYSKDLIEQLFIHPYSKIELLVDNLKLNRKTAGNYLKNFEDLGILEAESKGKEVIYVNIKLYNLLKRRS